MLLSRTFYTRFESGLALQRSNFDNSNVVPGRVEHEFCRYPVAWHSRPRFRRRRLRTLRGMNFLIAFSFPGRSACPSYDARCIVATAAHLADHVSPSLLVRQWLLAVPKRLRYFLHRDADLQGAALRLFLRVVERFLLVHSPGSGPAASLDSVTFIHRFGSRFNAHLHFHCVVIDGVFEPAPADVVVFHAAGGLEGTGPAGAIGAIARTSIAAE